MSLVLRSGAFDDAGEIPTKYCGDGENISPPLVWQGLPADTASLVLIVDDPDAPDPRTPRMVWDHWILYNLPPTLGGLAEGVSLADLPAGCGEGRNSWGRTGYGGPCPAIGRHRYFLSLYALDTRLPAELGCPAKNELLLAMEDHILAYTTLVGTRQAGSAGS